MNKFKNFLIDTNSIKRLAASCTIRDLGLQCSIAIIGLMLILTAQAQNRDDVPQPTVFQAAGPNATSIQSSVDQFRAALGANNGVTAPPQPLTAGRREINWDGGNPANTATTLSPTPLDAFLVGRGTRFTTPGAGFVQAPATGLADLFETRVTPTSSNPLARCGFFRPSTAT